jgi:multidrug efflux system outer membrane protein
LARTSNAQKNTPPDAKLKIIAGILLGNGLMAPPINRRAIFAAYRNANEEQIQVLIKYEQSILQAYLEVVNEQWNLRNLEQLKAQLQMYRPLGGGWR